MATKTAFPPEVMAALQSQTKFGNQAKKTTDPFASFAGPPGRYFARLQRIVVTFDKKDKSAIFTIVLTCLATVPDASSNSTISDTDCNGMPIRVRQSTKVTEKSDATKQDLWGRVMVNLQAFGIKTRNFGVRNGVEKPELFMQDMADAVDLINDNPPAIIVDVVETEGKDKNKGRWFKNCNLREIVDEETVARFGKATHTVSDEDLQLEDDDNSDDESTDEDAPKTHEEAVAIVKPLKRQQLLDALGEDKTLTVSRPLEEHNDEQLQLIAIAMLMKTDVPQYPPVEAKSGTDDDEEAPAPASDDEEEAPPVSKESKLLQLQLKVGTLDRAALKKAIRNAGGLKPEDKFISTQTDEELRQWLIDLKTGTKPPVCVVVPDEIPF